MSLIPSRASITSRATGSFAMSLTFIQQLIGNTSTIKRGLFNGKTGHYVMANTAMGWIQDHSFGLSKVGVQKLSESVRAYVFLTLSSQSSARSSIIGKDGRALNAQSIWRTSFEQLVKSDSGIGDEIRRYQDVLQYASSKVDFNVGEGVYMLPSNMVLLMGNRQGSTTRS